ncbi:hypothetical protein JD969_10490 [Planctomycetota bacterium]|nr:hypothetical protein JD969_10490 [Planctomycetota bacterium]
MNIIKPSLLCAIAVLTFTTSANAATVVLDPNTPNLAIGVNGILIDGITYNATFHDNTSFNAIWDPNADLDFSDSTTGSAPTFWISTPTTTFPEITAAEAKPNEAANQIIAALGDTYFTTNHTGTISDGFFIPNRTSSSQFSDTILIGESATNDLSNDGITRLGVFNNINFPTTGLNHVFTSFTIAPIPEPTSLVLLSLTTLPLMIRRKRSV